MFDKELKREIKEIKGVLSNMISDWDDYLEWKKMRDANRMSAEKQGHFYITADDTALLEKLIQETNKDPDLAVLLTTAQGTTLTLRSHPQSYNYSSKKTFNGLGEEDIDDALAKEYKRLQRRK